MQSSGIILGGGQLEELGNGSCLIHWAARAGRCELWPRRFAQYYTLRPSSILASFFKFAFVVAKYFFLTASTKLIAMEQREVFEVFDEDNKLIGTEFRDVVHATG